MPKKITTETLLAANKADRDARLADREMMRRAWERIAAHHAKRAKKK